MSKFNEIKPIKHGHLKWLIKQAESLIKQKRYHLDCEEIDAKKALHQIKETGGLND